MQEKPNFNKSQSASTHYEARRMKRVSYASVIGSIMYVVRCTRLEVAFAQNLCSQFQQNPGECQWATVKIILTCLRNTKDTLLVYEGNLEKELRVTCDTDDGFETGKYDRTSQSGYVFILNGGAVDWISTKQSTILMSSIEAEYIDASKTAIQAV
nr:hypothetical protein [Tanacetum cinerariifolium]